MGGTGATPRVGSRPRCNCRGSWSSQPRAMIPFPVHSECARRPLVRHFSVQSCSARRTRGSTGGGRCERVGAGCVFPGSCAFPRTGNVLLLRGSLTLSPDYGSISVEELIHLLGNFILEASEVRLGFGCGCGLKRHPGRTRVQQAGRGPPVEAPWIEGRG